KTLTDRTLTLSSVPSGDYTFQVKSFAAPGPFGDSLYSAPFSFTVGNCQSCHLPVVQMLSANPSTLWPPNGKMVPVTFQGSVTADCPVSGITYALTDSQGGSQNGTLTASGSGGLMLTLSLQASRQGGQQDGRTYTLGVTATNSAGSGTSNPVTVTV